MANDLTADPLVVDTTAAVRTGPCRLAGIKYVNTTAGAGVVTITDTTTGHILWEGSLAAAGAAPLDLVNLMVKGGVTVTMTTGTGRVYLYLGSGGAQA